MRLTTCSHSQASYFQHSRSDSIDFLLQLNQTRSSSSKEFFGAPRDRRHPEILSSQAIDEEYLMSWKNYRPKFTKLFLFTIFSD